MGKEAEYYLFPVEEEISDDFSSVILDLVQELLSSYQVFTRVYSMREQVNENKQECGEYFPARYYRFLEAHGLSEHVFFDGKKEILSVTQGINEPMICLLFEESKEMAVYDLYAYRKVSSFDSHEEVTKFIDNSLYEIYVEYAEYPHYLNIAMNPGAVSQEQLIELVNKFCEQHGKRLELQV